MFGLQSCHLFGKELPTMLAISSFCGCLIVFVCLSLWCWGPDKDVIVSNPDFIVCLSLWCWGPDKDIIVSNPDFTLLYLVCVLTIFSHFPIYYIWKNRTHIASGSVK